MGDVVSSLLFQPPKTKRALKESKVTWLTTKNGNRIPSVFLPCAVETRRTILYSHANAEDLADVYVWLKYLNRHLQVNVIGYDYSGYGQSDGETSEENCYADIDAVYDHLINERKLSPSDIILVGRSLGSGPSCYLAARTSTDGKPVAGVILHSPFTSIYRIMLDVGCTIASDRFPNIDFVPDIRCCVLFIHGTQDTIIPCSHSESLSLAVSKPYRLDPYLLEGVGHNSIPSECLPLFISRVQLFMKNSLNVMDCHTDIRMPSLNDEKYFQLTHRKRSSSHNAMKISSSQQAYFEEKILNVYMKAIHEQWIEVQL